MFDPLASTGSVAGSQGWRFNDSATEILYPAEVEALATLEIAVRTRWETIQQVLIATIDIPDGPEHCLELLDVRSFGWLVQLLSC